MTSDSITNTIAIVVICTLIYILAKKIAKGNPINRFTYVLIALVILLGFNSSWTKTTGNESVSGHYLIPKSESIMSKSYPESSNLSISTD